MSTSIETAKMPTLLERMSQLAISIARARVAVRQAESSFLLARRIGDAVAIDFASGVCREARHALATARRQLAEARKAASP